MAEPAPKILWPTDFSDLSLRAGDFARRLAQRYGAQLHIIHVIPPVLTPDFSVLLPVNVPIGPPETEMLDACRANLQRLVAERFGNDAGVHHEALFGNPWSTICEYAEREQIGLIVVATHGRTGFEHALIGSTAERIVRHAPCPVLTVKNADGSFLGK